MIWHMLTMPRLARLMRRGREILVMLASLLSRTLFFSRRLPAALNKTTPHSRHSRAFNRFSPESPISLGKPSVDICSCLASDGVATLPVPVVPISLCPWRREPRTQGEKGCGFHYLPINVPTDDSQGPFLKLFTARL